MDETKFENKLACFFSKVKKLVTDYMQHIDVYMGKLAGKVKECEVVTSKCEELCERAESSTVELGDVDAALDEIIAMQEELIGGTVTFTDGINTFTALKGMTFGKWVNSRYNTIGATVTDSNHIWWPEDNSTLSHLDGVYVTPTDVIVDGVEYEWC